MNKQALSDADLRRMTNLDELIAPRPEEHAPPVPSRPPQGSPLPPMRSTTDPFEINFYHADIVESLVKRSTGRVVRWFAWIFLAGPWLVLWPSFSSTIFDGGLDKKIGGEAWLLRFGARVVVTAICSFWPYVLLRRR